MFLLQLMGRIGRDIKRKELCYFDMFTTIPSFLNIEDITKLSGKDLLKRLDASYKSYIQDEQSIIKAKSVALDYDIRERAGFSCTFRRPGQSSTADVLNRIKREFKNINIQYGYNKELSLKIFTEVLKKANSMLQSSYLNIPYEKLHGTKESAISWIVNHHRIDDAIKILDSKQIESSIVQYSDDMSLEDYARYIVHAKPMSQDDLVKADPNSNAPIFMEQKERSQQQNILIHHASETASIFIGAVLAALALFVTMKVYEKKKEPDMGVGTAFKKAFLDLVTPWSNHRTGCEAG